VTAVDALGRDRTTTFLPVSRLSRHVESPHPPAYDTLDPEETVMVLPDVEFEATCERARRIDGGVAVVVRDGDGRLLLVKNEWSDGYVFPGGGVEPGEDWEAAAVREVREETGVEVRIDRPLRREREYYEHAESGERVRGITSVTFFATPVDGACVGEDPGVDGEEIQSVAWVDSVPERAARPELIERHLAGSDD
jgi:8-oxo-dGTP diphosphatase